jgi:chromosome segregation ATPase
MKATQMDRMSNDYSALQSGLELMESRIDSKKGGSSALETDYQKAERAYQDLSKMKTMEKTRDGLVKEATWAAIKDREDDLEARTTQHTKIIEDARAFEKKITKWNLKVAEFSAQVGSKSNAIAECTKKMEAKMSATEEAKYEMEKVKKTRKVQELARKVVEGEMKSKAADIASLKEQLREARTKHSGANDQEGERHRLTTEVDTFEHEIQRLREEMRIINQNQENCTDNMRRLEDNISAADKRVGDANIKWMHAKTQLKNLQQMSSGGGGGSNSLMNRVLLFGQDHVKLQREIGKERWNGGPPIGPLGAYISLTDDRWRIAIEKAIGKTMISYVVGHKDDVPKLKQMIYRHAVNQVRFIDVITMKRETRFKVSAKVPRELKDKYKSMEQLITVEDDHAYNAIINFVKVERIMCVPKQDIKKDEMYDVAFESNFSLHPIGKVYNELGDLAVPNASRRFYSNKDQSRPAKLTKTGVDMSDAVGQAEQDAGRCKHELDNTMRKKTELNQKRQGFADQMRGFLKATTKQKDDIKKIEKQIAATNVELNKEEVVPQDYTYLEEELSSTQADLDETKEEVKEASAAEKQKRTEEKPANEKMKKLREEGNLLEAERQKMIDSSSKLQDQIKTAKRKAADYEKQLAANETDADTIKADVEVLRKDLDAELEAAAQMNSERISTRKTSSKLAVEVEQMEKQIAAEKKVRGDPGAIVQAYKTAKESWESATRDLKNLENFRVKMNKMLAERQCFLHLAKHQISLSTKSEFRAALQQRDYTGKMSFQHEDQTISFSVNPRHVDKKKMKVAHQTSSATGAATSLSGGERSFTTASFILALWAGMDTPFRALDEFDVFMDAVNRQIAIKMMIDAARRQKHKQFILLSPLTMKILDNVRGGVDIKIIRMQKPEKGQTTLVF